MIKKIFIVLFFVYSGVLFAQKETEFERINKLETTLNTLKSTIPNLENKVNFNITNLKLPLFIKTLSKESKVNLSTRLEGITNIVLTHNFTNASVRDIVLYLCKEYELTFNVTGNIISLRKFIPVPEKQSYIPRNILVEYNKGQDLFSIDLRNDSLAVAFKKITDVTGKNLVFSPGLGGKKLSGYIKNKSFESAVDKLAFSNQLRVTKTKDDYYLFENDGEIASSNSQRIRDGRNGGVIKPKRYRESNFFFKVKDSVKQLLDVDFENIKTGSVIKDIANELKVNMFTNAPLNNIGMASVKANNITFDKLLEKLLEDKKFTFKKKEGIYYFGEDTQPSLKTTAIISLMHRSIEVMNQPMQSRTNRNSFSPGYNTGGIYTSNTNNFNNQNQNFNGNRNFNNNSNNFNNNRRSVPTQNSNFGDYSSKSEALINIIPKDITNGLEVQTDRELNSFVVTGDSQKVERFKDFIKKIDKPVPVILIEVMILEVQKSATVSAGVELGLGKEPTTDQGTLFSATDLTLGAKSINKIIGGFKGFGSKNIGRVVPNFYAKIQAMESNGNVKIRSTPKLSTLNGHQATLSNGQRKYYAVTRRDIIGSQNPQTSEIKNYVPIDADLSIAIKPMVSGNEQITMSINVVQSNFNGERIEPEAPPGMNSREFNSTIRVRDQDVIILGGLEENLKNDSGRGVPFLSRVPVIKWLFSKKTRTDSKTKLSVLIKPTIIR
ncbi:type II secretion system protein GspD [Tenacibaculum aiptasiae]|uniref:type II secretion system protein GspD n=1 Tax=Tenacibaculum aiptasiae TaxID=426481 RepID=UPI00232FA7C3|nr:general secretion pathway protein GspD [Tenacibaculum aiptasiae]